MASKLQEMLDKRNSAIVSARGLVDKADNEKRGMTAEEKQQYDLNMAEAVSLRGKIDIEIALLEEEKRVAEASLAHMKSDHVKPKTPEAEARAKAFRNFLTRDSITQEEIRSLTTGDSAQAGYLNAPQEFVQQLIAAVKNDVFIERLSTAFTTTNANGLGFPTIETDMADFAMITEIKTAPEDTTLAFGKREFKPHPSSKLVKISDAMLRADGMNPEAIVVDRATYKYAILKEYKYLLGTGNQEPLGLFVASDKGVGTARDVTMSYSDDFVADDIVNAKYNVKAQYMNSPNAGWLFNRTAVAKLAKVKDGVGRYLFEMTDKIGAMDQLKGSPLYMSEYVPNTFTASQYVGMFGDLSFYYTVNSLSLRIKRLNELYAATRQVGFLFDTEFDGMPVLAEAFSRIKTGTVAS